MLNNEKLDMLIWHDWHEGDQTHKVYLDQGDGSRTILMETPSVQSAMAATKGMKRLYGHAFRKGTEAACLNALEIIRELKGAAAQ